jgi:acyl carrier protein
MTRDDLTKKLGDFILRDILNRPDYPLTEDESLITGGLIDSYSLVRIAVFVENETGISIPDTDLTVKNMDTLRLIVDRILAEKPA